MCTALMISILTFTAFVCASVSYITHRRYEGYMCGTLHHLSSKQKERKMVILLRISYTTAILFYLFLIALWLVIPTWKMAFYCLLILCAVVLMSISGKFIPVKKKTSKQEITLCEGKNCLLKKNCYRYYAYNHYEHNYSNPMIIPFCPVENRPGYVSKDEVKGGEK